MNSIRRGAPVPVAPVLMMSVIFPKLALGLGAGPVKEPNPLAGFLKVGWLNRLKAAARKYRLNLSVNLNVLVKEESISNALGPRAIKRPALPHVPFAGRAKAV